MQTVSLRYRKNITEVYKIILMLAEEDRAKIPTKIIDFFRINSLNHMLEQIEMTPEMIESGLSRTTRKFLKMVAIYLS